MPDAGNKFKQARLVTAILVLGVHLLFAFSVTQSDRRGRGDDDRGELRDIEVRLIAGKGGRADAKSAQRQADEFLLSTYSHETARAIAQPSQHPSRSAGDVAEPARSKSNKHYYTKDELRSPPQFQTSDSEQPVVPESVAKSPLTVTLLIGEDGHVDAVEFNDLSTSLATHEYTIQLRAYLLGLKFTPGMLSNEPVPSKLRIFVSAEPL
jgi:hypothetical protein